MARGTRGKTINKRERNFENSRAHNYRRDIKENEGTATNTILLWVVWSRESYTKLRAVVGTGFSLLHTWWWDRLSYWILSLGSITKAERMKAEGIDLGKKPIKKAWNISGALDTPSDIKTWSPTLIEYASCDNMLQDLYQSTSCSPSHRPNFTPDLIHLRLICNLYGNEDITATTTDRIILQSFEINQSATEN